MCVLYIYSMFCDGWIDGLMGLMDGPGRREREGWDGWMAGREMIDL
jgi:hypothetical protein